MIAQQQIILKETSHSGVVMETVIGHTSMRMMTSPKDSFSVTATTTQPPATLAAPIWMETARISVLMKRAISPALQTAQQTIRYQTTPLLALTGTARTHILVTVTVEGTVTSSASKITAHWIARLTARQITDKTTTSSPVLMETAHLKSWMRLASLMGTLTVISRATAHITANLETAQPPAPMNTA
jgi:hypothetical protein